jgi:hypothetical protein
MCCAEREMIACAAPPIACLLGNRGSAAISHCTTHMHRIASLRSPALTTYSPCPRRITNHGASAGFLAVNGLKKICASLMRGLSKSCKSLLSGCRGGNTINSSVGPHERPTGATQSRARGQAVGASAQHAETAGRTRSDRCLRRHSASDARAQCLTTHLATRRLS